MISRSNHRLAYDYIQSMSECSKWSERGCGVWGPELGYRP